MPELDEDAPLSPGASLVLIAEQQEVAHRRLDIPQEVFLGPWGVAWLVGYGLFFPRYGPDEKVLVSMPSWLPMAVLYTLLVAAGIVSGITISRATKGVVGDSAERGAMYSWSWFVAFAGYGVLGWRLHDHLPEERSGS